MEEEQYYKFLVKRFTDRTATDEELEVFIKLANEGKLDTYLVEAMNEDAGIIEDASRKFSKAGKIRLMWKRIAVAASILLLLSTASYLLFQNNVSKRVLVANNEPQDIAPGRNQATLTLANGKKIILSRGLSGQLAQEGDTKILINNSSEVVYKASEKAEKVGYNTLSTAKGEVSPFPLVLPDGTKVWLNAESSITFPTAFVDSKRYVEITGEAYFEVAHNAAKTFTVKAGNQMVEDIGTAFNINSYSDEPNIKTTLIEGAAKVIANGTSKTLNPGQRTVVSPKLFLLQTTDSEAETAWMAGKFIFNDEELHSVMRQLARWYKIEVFYEYNPENVLLGGGFSKSRNISKVLKAFEQTGAVKFKIKGKVVHVTR